MIRKHVLLTLTLCTALALFAVTAYAATDNFFAGKTVRIIVAAIRPAAVSTPTRDSSRGTCPSTYRATPRWWSRTGPGAGGLIAANHLYNKAKPDGLTIGNWIGGLDPATAPGEQGRALRRGQVRVDRRAGADPPTCA